MTHQPDCPMHYGVAECHCANSTNTADPLVLLENAHNHVGETVDPQTVLQINTAISDPVVIERAAQHHNSLLVRLLCARLIRLERITHVAIARRGKVYSLPVPADYDEVLFTITSQHGEQKHPVTRGYLTNTGRFVEPPQALQIARVAGQVVNASAGRKNLFPTDLW